MWYNEGIMSKRKAPLKNCPECSEQSHARVATCKCGHVFYQKKNRNSEIKDWQNLQKGDIIKSVNGHGPFWINPETEEKVYMGTYGKFKVHGIGKNYLLVVKIKNNYTYGGIQVLYMGKPLKSSLSDNLYSYPHKLVAS